MQRQNNNTYNISLKKKMKHLEWTFATSVYNHYNMCNISIYFCNIHMKHLQHTFETSETIETYSCNMRFQHNISLLLGRMDARRCVVFTGGCGLAALVGGRPVVVAARRAREASAAPCLAGPAIERRDSRLLRAVPSKASGQAVGLGGNHTLRLGGPAPCVRRRQASG